ncbi:MAG: carbohydrate binding domain-containing protein, partial [Phycisphaerales bacterium]
DEKLRKAWSSGTEPLGANIVDNGDLKEFPPSVQIPSRWQLEQHSGCRASVSIRRYKSRDALRIDIARADPTEWHLQFKQSGLALEADRYYTVTFEAASERPRKLGCGVSQAHEPWKNLGLSRQADLKQDWQTFRFGFAARENEENSRLSFAFGGSNVPFYLANVQLRPGGRVGLGEHESAQGGSVALYADNEGPQRAIDRMRFLAETEKSFFDDMRSFIKNDLGCRALVAGTIVFGPLGLYAQSDMDFIDGHAYWQHPRFPDRPWDQSNWLVDQKPMVDYPEQSPLFRLAAQRLEGKPYTVSEYNHPAPLDSQAECVPMIASFGALQDWDGIWLYTYSHGTDDWYRGSMNGFFDIDTNPAKWGFMRAGTAIFRDGAIRPFGGRLVVSLRKRLDTVTDLANLHLQHDRDMWNVVSAMSGVREQTELNQRVYLSLKLAASDSKTSPAQARLMWSADDKEKVYMAAGGAGVLAGHTSKFQRDSDGYARISRPEYAVITATSLDGAPWPQSNKILITACGRCENTGMKFSKYRRTVGRQWGRAPVQIETVEGTVMVPVGRWRCQALGPDGDVKADVPVRVVDDANYVDLSSKHSTMWYLLTRI